MKGIMSINTEKTNAFFGKCEISFKFSFLILCLINFNAFTFGNKIASFFVITTLALAGVCLVGRVLNYKHYVSKSFFLVLLFLISYVVSLALTISYGYLEPTKTFIWLALHLFLLFVTDDRKSMSEYKRKITPIFCFYTFVMFVSSTASIVLMFLKYSNIRYFGNIRIISGFTWGRLWGVYTDPNYASVMAIICVLISLYFTKTATKLFFRVFNIINIVVQFMYICFSDSRTGLVTLFVAVFVYTLLLGLKREGRICKWGKTLLSVLLALLVGVFSVFSVSALKTGYNLYISSIAQQDSNNNVDSESNVDDNPELSVGREQDIKGDISNRRFDLWKSGLETVITRPLFGISFNNLVPYVMEHLPNTYLVNNDHGVFNNYHNAWINILVGQGFIGFAIFLLLGVVLGIKSIKRIAKRHSKEDGAMYIVCFSIVIASLVSSLFLQELVYTLSPNTYMFWLLLGVLVSKNPKKDGEQV